MFPGVGNVYYHPRAVINVSLGMIESEPEKFRVRHVPGSHFVVKNIETGMCMRFSLKNGLYISEVDVAALSGSMGKNISNDIDTYVLATIETVAKNESAHTARDVARAKAVLPLIQALGYPSRKSLTKMLNAKSITNCPVTVADVNRFLSDIRRNRGGHQRKDREETTR